jgi:SAM-dependent methyltransferase
MAGADELSHELYGSRKRALLGDLRGRVLEIGPGTGVNLRYFGPEVRWVGVEPNPAMHPHLRAEAERLGLEVELLSGISEGFGVAAESFDAVVSTLVLCSVGDLAGTLREIRRLLKPGGKFVFLEHVADRPWSPRWIVQKAAPFTPWRYFSDGCDPGREIGTAIEAAGFDRVDCRPYRQEGPGIILAINRPHIWGTAIKAQ